MAMPMLKYKTMPFLERFKKRRPTPERFNALYIPLSERSEKLVDKLLEDLKHGFMAEFTPSHDDEWIYGAEPKTFTHFFVGLKYDSDTYFMVDLNTDINTSRELNVQQVSTPADMNSIPTHDRHLSFGHYDFRFKPTTYSPTYFHHSINNSEETAKAADEMMTQSYLAKVDAQATLHLFNKVKERGFYQTVRWPRYRST